MSNLLEKITGQLEAFYNRLVARVKRNDELLAQMHAEEDFRKSMSYIKEFFSFKKEV